MKIYASFYDTRATLVSKKNPMDFDESSCEIVKREMPITAIHFYEWLESEFGCQVFKEVWLVTFESFGWLVVNSVGEILEQNSQGAINVEVVL